MNSAATASSAFTHVTTLTSEERGELISSDPVGSADLAGGGLPDGLSAEGRIQFLLMQYLFSSRANFLDFCN